PFEPAAVAAAAEPAPVFGGQPAVADGALILVAEDDATNQKVIVRQLALLGHAADVAGTGTEALELWRTGSSGLLPTDLHMPEMGGADDALLRDFLASYRESAREAAAALRGAVAQEDAAGAIAIAHRLKSSSLSVGARGLGQVCDEIERDGASALAPRLPRFEA